MDDRPLASRLRSPFPAGIASGPASALDLTGLHLPEWAEDTRLNVFGSLSFARSNSATRYNIETYDEGTYREGTLLGAHLSVPLGDRLTAETQVLAELRHVARTRC